LAAVSALKKGRVITVSVNLRVKFKKYGAVRYIGHLDVMRFFQKCNRRAELDVAYTKGFSPHQIMSFASPLSVGLESNGEYMDVTFESFTSCEDTMKRMNAASVPGIEIISVKLLPSTAGNAMASVAAAKYTVGLKESAKLSKDYAQALKDFLSQPEILLSKEGKNGERVIDIKPGIFELSYSDDTFSMTVDASSSGNIKPIQVLRLLYLFMGEVLPENSLIITREETYTSDAGKLVPLDACGVNSLEELMVLEEKIAKEKAAKEA